MQIINVIIPQSDKTGRSLPPESLFCACFGISVEPRARSKRKGTLRRKWYISKPCGFVKLNILKRYETASPSPDEANNTHPIRIKKRE